MSTDATTKVEKPSVNQVVQQVEAEKAVQNSNVPAVQATGQVATSGPMTDAEDYGLSPEEIRAMNLASAQNTDATEIQISRLAIIQDGSPEVKKKPPEPGFWAGQIVDNKTRQILSIKDIPPWLKDKGITDVEPCDFVILLPIFKLPIEFIQWKDRKTEGDGWHFKTLDEKDQRVRQGAFPPFGNWKPNPATPAVKAPPVTSNINYIGVCIDLAGNVIGDYQIATFAKGNVPVGKKISTALQYVANAGKPYWSQAFGIFTYWQTNPKGDYYALDANTVRNYPKLPRTMKMCADIARYLAPGGQSPTKEDKELGRSRQEGFLNAAEPDHGDSSETPVSAEGQGGPIPPNEGEPNF